MKTLILCVDRDDDLGTKGGVATPVVGRRRMVDAALALGLADPEDSDTNALLAAVHLFDLETRSGEQTGDQVEVACVTGHKALGLRGDRKLGRELDEVMQLVRPDQVVLVSDGAEDEQVLPILQSRAPVIHVHRSIVKQAPRLEGFYYVLTRILDDEKQAKRFVLPVAIVALVLGVAWVAGLQEYAWGLILAFIGAWLLVHAMKWEGRVGSFFSAFGSGLKSGKVSLLANLVTVLLLVLGGFLAVEGMKADQPPPPPEPQPGDPPAPEPPPQPSTALRTLQFMGHFLPWVVVALLVSVFGALLDGWFRHGRTSLAHWLTGFTLIAFYFFAHVGLQVAVAWLEGTPWRDVVRHDTLAEVFIGFAVAAGAILINRYFRAVLRPQAA